jgi:hypothetical protein
MPGTAEIRPVVALPIIAAFANEMHCAAGMENSLRPVAAASDANA